MAVGGSGHMSLNSCDVSFVKDLIGSAHFISVVGVCVSVRLRMSFTSPTYIVYFDITIMHIKMLLSYENLRANSTLLSSTNMKITQMRCVLHRA